jgi:peptidyl-prolyl cis-trans isomerase A (cyclophilin A)
MKNIYCREVNQCQSLQFLLFYFRKIARSFSEITVVLQLTMVAVQRPRSNRLSFRINILDKTFLCYLAVIAILYVVVLESDPDSTETTSQLRQVVPGASSSKAAAARPLVVVEEESAGDDKDEKSSFQCPYMSLKDLTESELFPQKGTRHMVSPPQDRLLTLVCCETTKGPLSIAAHHNWAPRGAEKFLEMVRAGYFSKTVPLMRCMKGFLCQFGLTADANLTKAYRQSFPDDHNWLPEGPTNRENAEGVFRFARGYMAYAGAGPNSRSNQFIMSLAKNRQLAGGSPWEVPWGELVGKHSFETLDKIYTGYGEKGPGQGELMRLGVTDETREKFPNLDYVLSCEVVDETTTLHNTR